MENDDGNYILLMIDLFKHINMVVESYDTIMTALYSKIDKYEYFVQQIYKDLLHNDDNKDHIPIPVSSYITPTMNTSFMLHIMLSMDIFDIKIETTLQPNLR